VSAVEDQQIYLSPPDMSDRERASLLQAFDSNWIAPVGPEIDAFERELAARAGVPAAAALSSGTAGLHLALVLAGVGPGDEVWTSTLTFAATANAVRYVGATPVFVDCAEQSWNLDPALLSEGLREAARRDALPKAIIAVDLYGHCADYEAIGPLCEEYGVFLIEDAAEALGASHRGRAAGSFGQISVLSFNGNKIITTSGGGALLSRDPDMVARARHLASQAKQPVAHYEHEEIGYNYRLSNLLAAIGRAQLARLDDMMARRRAVYARYYETLSPVDGVSFLPTPGHSVPNCWLSCVLVDSDRFGAGPEAIRKHLESHRIEARPIWKPMHLQPVFRGARVLGGAVAERLFGNGLCLPSGSSLSRSDQQRVIDALLDTPGARGGRTQR
jgi:dTDP-4-amino-4,6-dideoxygalactose transaminase